MTEYPQEFHSTDFKIRVGSVNDKSKIEDFALRLSEDPISSANKWIKIISQKNVHPLLAEKDERVIGKVQVRIVEDVGWLESARVAPEFRKKGVGVSLLNSAMDWIKNSGVKYIRASVDSDNMKIRLLLEKNNFTGHSVLINPHCHINDDDKSAQFLSRFSTLLDNSVFPEFEKIINDSFTGNVMVDGQYIPFTQKLFDTLIQEKRILTNGSSTTFLIISKHKLDEELNTFVYAESQEMYKELGLASKALAAQESAGFVECLAPTKRIAVQGLIEAGLGWTQPHTLIIYQRAKNF